jgi:multidrug efflux pump subunit AcrA (membrane-fusion protein)
MHPSQSCAQPRAALLLGMAAVLLSACGSSDAPSGAGAAAREAVMTVTATPLTRVELTRTVSMTGSVYAWQDVIIASEVGGYRVAEVFVDVGDRVTKGQRLVAMSRALLEAEVATKQAVCTSSANVVFASHPSIRFALEGSPSKASTSVGRK